MNDALTTARASDIHRMAAKSIRPEKTGRIVYIHHANRTAWLLGSKRGILRTRIDLMTVDGRTSVHVPNNSIVVA